MNENAFSKRLPMFLKQRQKSKEKDWRVLVDHNSRLSKKLRSVTNEYGNL